ncbi:MAG: molybdopterin dinucleotide binding domain-containing protein, partial [Pseudohongiellaceae bacterium]
LVEEGRRDLDAAFEKMSSGQVDNVIVLENDLYRRAPQQKVESALKTVKQLAVIDQIATPTTDAAHLLIASASFAEQEASYVNYEGRAQLSYQVYRGESSVRAAWSWLQPADDARHFNQLVSDCAKTVPAFAGLAAILPDPGHYPGGLKVPRQSHRYSGRTAMTANLAVNEPKQPVDEESIMSFSMEGASVLKDSYVLSSAWSPQWNSNQSISKFQAEIYGPLLQSSGEVQLLSSRPAVASGNYYANKLPAASGKEWQSVRALQIFGSDELSACSPAIRSRMTGNYAALSPADAARLGVAQGQRLNVTGSSASISAATVIRKTIKPGTVALYCESDHGAWSGLQGTVSIAVTGAEIESGSLGNLIVSDLLQEGS